MKDYTNRLENQGASTEVDELLDRRLCFAYGRIRAVNAILAFDHRGPCRTDDGPVYLDLMLPYAVEVAHLRPEATFEGAWRRMRYWLPSLCADLGRCGFADQWDELCNLRSMAKGRHRTESDLGHIDWLPTAERITAETRLTQVKRSTINAMYPDRPPIRGIGVIDPPTAEEKRESNRLRMQAVRLSQGVVPQSERTLTADAAELAKLADCNERTIRRHRDAKTLDAYLRKRGVNVQDLCAPYNKIRNAHILDMQPELEPLPVDLGAERLAILREILADPYGVEIHDDLCSV